MSNISAAAVASLRARTGVSIIQCKKALEEAGGDEEKAIEILRSKGEAQAVKKAEREQTEGYIFGASEGGKTVIFSVNCETDFVSRSDDFQAFGKELAQLALQNGDGFADAAKEVVAQAVQKMGENISLGEVHFVDEGVAGIYIHTNGKIGVIVSLNEGEEDQAKDVAMHAAAMNPSYLTPEEVSDDEVAKEKQIWEEQLKEEGKPAEIMEKIMTGKEKKFREENALLTQSFVKNPEQTVRDYLGGAEVIRYVSIKM